MTQLTQEKEHRLIVQLAVLTLGRLFLNTGLRMTYPFLPEMARGLGVSLTDISRLVAIRAFVGFLSPLFGPFSDRFGRRPVIAAALFLFGAGCFIVVLWPAYWPLGMTLGIIGVAKVIYDPAMQAYLGDIVPYQQRGRALAVTELSWAGALLLGAPAVGFILQRQGWQAPFFWLGLGGIACALLVWRIIPRENRQLRPFMNLAGILRTVRQAPVIWAAATYVLLAMMANEMLLIIYGDWMEGSFALNLTSLGLASGAIGGAEIIGEVVAGWSVDRFGKRPVIIVTGFLAALTYFLIPYTSASLSGALISLFILFLFFEITIVGGMPLLTEIVPSERSVVMSTVVASASLGRAAGALIGPLIWVGAGFSGSSLATAAIMTLSIIVLALWVREG